MTRRELEILHLLHDGLSNAEIAQRLVLSSDTVKWYTQQIYSKFDVNSRTAAVARARNLGVLGTENPLTEALAPIMARKTNLPPQSSVFVGRDPEISELNRLLGEPNCRLLTLVGPGGIGKTRLALQVAGMQLKRYAHGVFLVTLQAVSSPELIATAIASAIGVQAFDESETKQGLLDHLRSRRVLLVLDNLEHLLEGIDIISAILSAAPNIKILATSREALNLYEEWLFTVPVMAVPPDNGATGADAYSAVQLFVHTARRMRADFSFADESASVARICRLVAGMPLAIELAAAWVRALPCSEIADEIERSLDILETSARNVPPRHRSMRAALDHSWSLLTEAEREIYQKLAVFRGGFTREAAQVVANASLRMLSVLMDKSLLWRAPNGRYDMHELLRQYAEEQLTSSPALADQARSLHCAYYAALVQEKFPQLRSFHRRLATDAFEVELDNVRDAWRWALKTRSVTEIGKSVLGLHEFYFCRPRYQEAFDAFRLAADALRPAWRKPEVTPVLARVLALQANCYMALSNTDLGKTIAQESLALARRAQSPDDIMLALYYCAKAACWTNQHDVKQCAMREGLQIARETRHEWYEAMFLRCEADDVLFLECITEDQAATYLKAAMQRLSHCEQVGDPALILDTYHLLGVLAELRGVDAEAKRYYSKILALSQEVGDVAEMASVYVSLAMLAVTRKSFTEARYCLRRNLEIGVEVGSRRWQTATLVGVSHMFVAENQERRAVEMLALAQHHPAIMTISRLYATQLLAKFERELGPEDYAEALEVGQALDLDATLQVLIAEFSHEPVISA